MIKKMKRSINILVLGIVVVALLSFGVVWVKVQISQIIPQGGPCRRTRHRQWRAISLGGVTDRRARSFLKLEVHYKHLVRSIVVVSSSHSKPP